MINKWKKFDKLLLEVMGWKKVAVDDLIELQPYTRYAWEKDGSCTVRFPSSKIKYHFSPSTDDYDAQDCIKALAEMGINGSYRWSCSNPPGYDNSLVKHRLCFPGINIDTGWKDTLSAALIDAVLESDKFSYYEGGYIDKPFVKKTCCHIRPAILKRSSHE
jgi:hypothetical protein